MNAIIESTPKKYTHYRDTRFMMLEFMAILENITKSTTEAELRENMAKSIKLNCFEYGFGGNHLWVKQNINGKTNGERVIFVDFIN